MVAGPDSCACPECGVTCYGRFPGCAEVWARGPRQVTARRLDVPERPVHEARTVLGSLPPPTQLERGNGSSTEARPQQVELLPANPSVDRLAERVSASVLQRLEPRLSRLAERLDRADDELRERGPGPSQRIEARTGEIQRLVEGLVTELAAVAHRLEDHDDPARLTPLTAAIDRLAGRLDGLPPDVARLVEAVDQALSRIERLEAMAREAAPARWLGELRAREDQARADDHSTTLAQLGREHHQTRTQLRSLASELRTFAAQQELVPTMSEDLSRLLVSQLGELTAEVRAMRRRLSLPSPEE